MDQTEYRFGGVLSITNNYIPMSYLFVLTFIILSGIAESDIDVDYSHDIILIQGEPKLVAMTESGEIIRSFDVSTDYFSSSDSHDDIVELELDRNESLMRTRFISFQTSSPDLTEDAVEHVRYMTVLAENNRDLDLVITAPDDDSAQEVMLATTSLITDFGVKKDRIKIVYKNYTGDDENQFIKIALEPKKTS